jgi:hypothetical protein
MEVKSDAIPTVDWVVVTAFSNQLQATRGISEELGEIWRFNPNASTQHKSYVRKLNFYNS